jgi:hypothetical protein
MIYQVMRMTEVSSYQWAWVDTLHAIVPEEETTKLMLETFCSTFPKEALV